MKLVRAEIERYVDTVSQSLALEIAPTHRPGVVINLERLFQQSELFMDFPLSENLEAAPVFTA